MHEGAQLQIRRDLKAGGSNFPNDTNCYTAHPGLPNSGGRDLVWRALYKWWSGLNNRAHAAAVLLQTFRGLRPNGMNRFDEVAARHLYPYTGSREEGGHVREGSPWLL